MVNLVVVGLGGESGVKEFEGMAVVGTRRDRVERTLLSAAFDVVVGLAFFRRRKIRTNAKVKSGGQECPPYTFQHPRHPPPRPSCVKPVS